MEPIYHITSMDEVAQRLPIYAPGAYETDGFIHCSYRHQVRDVANRRFAGRSGLVLLEINRARLTAAVVDENLEGGAELFPHIYGRLPMLAVARIHELPCRPDGGFELPATLAIPTTSC